MQNETDRPLDKALEVMDKVLTTGDTTGLPPHIAAAFDALQESKYTDSEIKHMMLLTVCITEAMENIADVTKVLGGNQELMTSFFKTYATQLYDAFSGEYGDVYTYGALMLSLGALMGVEFTERRHA